MRIAMVSEHASPLAVLGGADAGGQNVHVGALAGALVRLGHEVTVYTRRDGPDLPPVVTTEAGFVVRNVDAGPPVPIAKDDLFPLMQPFGAVLEEEWSRRRPDVVHAHFWMSGLASLDAAGPLGVPVVQTFHALGAVKRRHQGREDTSPAARLEAEVSLIGRTDRIVATCLDEAGELRALGADPARISVVPCGVDLAHFNPDGDHWPRNRRPRLTVVGRLVPRKGVADAISALTAVPRAELLVAGGPPPTEVDRDPEVRRLRRVAEQQGVGDRVRFIGRVPRPDVPALMRSSDIVVCVPTYEPFGIVPLEAMACGVPVVATAVGGLQESVDDGRTGILVPPSDPDTLGRTLQRLLADKRGRARMGRAGVKRARRRYGWGRVAEETVTVYSDVVASAKAVLR